MVVVLAERDPLFCVLIAVGNERSALAQKTLCGREKGNEEEEAKREGQAALIICLSTVKRNIVAAKCLSFSSSRYLETLLQCSQNCCSGN